MPRMGRIVVPHYPHHVVQRGHNRQVIFPESRDYERYLATLRDMTREFRVAVYAYCLMTNHVHLLLVPSQPDGLGRLMKRLGGRQTRHYNQLEDRTGTLWDGRYHSSLVDREDYLLACLRYIELNPVRAGIVGRPEDYPWSSCRFRLGRGTCDWLELDLAYLTLGATDAERRQRYREFLGTSVPDGEWDLIRQAAHRGQLTGSDRFAEEISQIIGRRVVRRGRGRPRAKQENKSVPIFEK